MWAYMGTDTEPTCNQGFCWYFPIPALSITAETLAKFKMEGVDWNNRAEAMGQMPVYKFQQKGLLYVEPTTTEEAPTVNSNNSEL